MQVPASGRGLLEVLDFALPAADIVGQPCSTQLKSGYRLPGEVLPWHWAQGCPEREAQASAPATGAQPATGKHNDGAGSSRGQGHGGGGGSAETLLGAIARHPHEGEYVQAKAATMHAHRLEPGDVRHLKREAAVQVAFSSHICTRMLSKLAECSCHLQECGWEPLYEIEYSHGKAVERRLCGEAPHGLLGDEQPGPGQGAAAVPAGSSGAHSQAREAPFAAGTAARTRNATNATSNSSARRRTDLTLVLVKEPQQRDQQQQTQALCPEPEEERPVLVLEVKRLATLMERDGTPRDLLGLYDSERLGITAPGAPKVEPMFAQLYTYLVDFGLCHGALTCYGATWLVYVPRWGRERMYVSHPILATASGPASLLRALSWLQQQALRFAMSGEYPAAQPPPPPQQQRELWRSSSRHGGGAPGGGGQAGGGGGQPGPGDDDGSFGGPDRGGPTSSSGGDPDYVPSRASLEAARRYAQLPRAAAALEPAGASGAASGGAPATAGSGSGGPAAAGAQPEVLAQLWFRSVMDRGRDGTVYDGRLGAAAGTPVVIKVYCMWDPEQEEAYAREVAAYRALARLQGSWIPRVLASGRLAGDLPRLRCLVMEPVAGGQRLSDYPGRPFPGTVVDAALDALRQAHDVAGFLHGDIRLQNILLVTAAAGDDDGGGGAGTGPGREGGSGGPAVTGGGGTSGGASSSTGAGLRCVLLDFGGSRLDGTAAQQAAEMAELRRLLSAGR
ncbi:hypothetical protein HXX76_013381 [Chlamydomonas incerta]|uniref:Protein kinase domain-containing protein n=1 Tax=Chlamydomonas incerta TaxID=51695 RepID=A0A835VSD0_CHLIN|nr:hypothetical protein HXX76_013381 [Chlamydomonas incerta]|eukprot:KAG2426010.1 hypothetical protein HXX76_013381 [Chlamydomonas incerta]